MRPETIAWKNNKVRIVDQTKLPHKLVFLDIADIRSMWQAIKKLKVRGAPAIGIAGAFGVVLGVQNSRAKTYTAFHRELARACLYLVSCRPTAVNLSWAVNRMQKAARRHAGLPVGKIKKILLHEALAILNEDKQICRRMAKNGARLVKKGDRILTHCNAGGLATADYGTALGVLFEARKQGKHIKVYADETRPLLQGSRLTAWELMQEGIDVTVICDNMAASLMEKGMIDKIFVGADRIARNGDAANKIGTYNLAVLAHYHKIPFYIVAPLSTVDFSIRSGSQIPIEQRDPEEVRSCLGRQIAPKNAKVYNPAFDVTPHRLITAIVTEKDVVKPWNLKSLASSA